MTGDATRASAVSDAPSLTGSTWSCRWRRASPAPIQARVVDEEQSYQQRGSAPVDATVVKCTSSRLLNAWKPKIEADRINTIANRNPTAPAHAIPYQEPRPEGERSGPSTESTKSKSRVSSIPTHPSLRTSRYPSTVFSKLPSDLRSLPLSNYPPFLPRAIETLHGGQLAC